MQNTILQAGTGQILSQFFQSLIRHPEELAAYICMSRKGIYKWIILKSVTSSLG